MENCKRFARLLKFWKFLETLFGFKILMIEFLLDNISAFDDSYDFLNKKNIY